MPNDDINMGDIVSTKSHGAAGIYKVMMTRNTVGINRPQDEMLLQDISDESVTMWDKRGNLYKLTTQVSSGVHERQL